MANPSDSKRNRASVEKIEAVSGALMARKSLLDRPPKPAKFNLPDVARSIGDIARRPNALAAPRSNFEGHSISLDPARVELPGGALDDRSKDVEPSREEIGRENTMRDRPSRPVEANHEPIPAVRAIPSASFPVKDAVAADPTPSAREGTSVSSPAPRIDGSIEKISEVSGRPEEEMVAATRSLPTSEIHVENGGSHDLGGVGEPESRRDLGSASGNTGRPAPIRIGGSGLPSDRVDTEVSAKVSAVGSPRSGEGGKPPQQSRTVAAVQNSIARLDSSGPMADHPSSPSNHGEASMSFVRNPLSSGLADFSMSGPALPDQGGSASDQGGLGNPASGGSTSPPVGNSGDLSRTNELLQQLIDAVRKQRGSSLPTGGPSVYPDR
jgi:hypothetical protein